jgi:hypothetical protein
MLYIAETKNPLNDADADQYCHVKVLQDLDIPSTKAAQQVRSIIDTPHHPSSSDFIDALVRRYCDTYISM